MYRLTPIKAKQREEDVKKAILLYQEGLTYREIKQVIHRSHEWIRQVVKNNPQATEKADNS